MTVFLIGATEAAARDVSHVLQLDVLLHVHMLVTQERDGDKEKNCGRIWAEMRQTTVLQT